MIDWQKQPLVRTSVEALDMSSSPEGVSNTTDPSGGGGAVEQLHSHIKLSISADEVNLLVYRYLMEAGFRHSAFTFEAESRVPQTSAFATTQIPPGALVSLLQKALIYLYIQSHCGKNGEQIRCEGSFSLLRPHEHLVPTATVSEEEDEEEEEEEEFNNRSTKRSSRGGSRRNSAAGEAFTDDTSLEDYNDDSKRRHSKGSRSSVGKRDEEEEEDGEDSGTHEGSSMTSSPRSKRRRRRRRMQKEQERRKGEETDGSQSSASAQSTGNVKDTASEVKAQEEEGEKGEEGSPAEGSSDRPPKMRKRGRLVTAGPLAAAEAGEGDGEEGEEEDAEMKTEEEEGTALGASEEPAGTKGDDRHDGKEETKEEAIVMPLVYQLADPSRDRSSLHCLSPVAAMQWSPVFDGLLATVNGDGQVALFWSPMGGDDSSEQREWNKSSECDDADGIMGYLLVDASATSINLLLQQKEGDDSMAAAGQQQAYLSWSATKGKYSVLAVSGESSRNIRLRWVERTQKGFVIAGRAELKYSQAGEEEKEEEGEGGGFHAVEFCGTESAGSSPITGDLPEVGGTIAATSTYLAASMDESVLIWQVDCSRPGESPELIWTIEDTSSFSMAWLGSTYLALGTLSPYTLLVDTRDNAQKKLFLVGEGEEVEGGSSSSSNRFILECSFDDSGSKRLAAITDSEPTDAYVTVWMDPTARRPNKPVVLRINSKGETPPLQAQEMIRWMPGSDGDVLCAAYEGGVVVVWDVLNQSVLHRLPCIDTITAIEWQRELYLGQEGEGGDVVAPPLLVTMMLGKKCVIWSEGRVVSAFDLRCDDENAPGYIAWCPTCNYLAASAGGNETPLIFDVKPVVKEASRRFMTSVKQQ